MIASSRATRPAPVVTEEVDDHVRSKVLIVDDDERNLLALREVLDDIAEVVCAASGEEALRRLLQEQFAVIVLDVLMPGLDGYETAALIRAREQSRDTPIIFLTAINKEEVHLLRGYDTGAVDFVFKPVEPSIVRSKVSVFVSLFQKTAEIQRTSAVQKRLLEEKLEAQQQSLIAAQALREAEQRQELILSSLPLAVYVEDSETGAMNFVVGNIKDLCGFENQDFQKDANLFASRVLASDASYFASPIKEGRRNREYRWQHPDGNVRTFLDQAVVLGGQSGTVAGTVRDITEQRLMQDQLVQAQKMDAIGKLTGGVAHDFNNLLASVLGGLDILERRSKLEGKALEVLHMTRHAAEQGKHLVSRLLTFSRRQNLAPTAVDLHTLSHSIHALLAPILGGLVRLNWQLDEHLWDVFVDPSQLELAIMNLAINSRDAMASGGDISIRMRNSSGAHPDELVAGEYVIITISDTGSGIPPEIVSRVLEPFFTTKDVGKGTGLGLSMAYGFARQSGGTLRIASQPGRGTDVELWLPRNRLSVKVPPQPSGNEGASCEHGRSHHILLVDDSPILLHMTEVQLRDRGFEVTGASSAVDAIALIEKDPGRYDLLLTDYAMPTMSGLDLIRAARSTRSDLPAVIITGYAEVEALEARPADVVVVTKPCSPESLSGVIAQVLQPLVTSSSH